MKKLRIDGCSFKHLLWPGILILFSLFSCKKFIEVNPPDTRLVTASVFSDVAAVTSAQLSIYAQMANNGESWQMSQNIGILGDELTSYSTSLSQ
jgi:hypothetical protein